MSECKREFHIAGDYIENQTNNFYDNSQYNSTGAVMNEKKTKDARTPKPERKSCVPKLTSKSDKEKPRERMTFKKRGIQEAHILLLYQKLLDFNWISKDNNQQDFLDLFSGELSDCKVIWGKKFGKSTLVFLFNYFEYEGVISVPKGYSIPNILMGHFVDEEGNFLTNLDKGNSEAPKCGKEAQELLNVLKLNSNRQGRRAKRVEAEEDDDEYDYSGYGEEIPSHLEDEQLSYSSKPY